MPLVGVPRKPKERYIEYCLAAKNAATWGEYKSAELKARVCSELIKDFWGDEVWFLIICDADEAVEVDAKKTCGIVFRTMSDFETLAKAQLDEALGGMPVEEAFALDIKRAERVE